MRQDDTKDYFGYATGVAEDGKYTGLVFGSPAPGVYFDNTSVVVRPEVAVRQVQEKQRDTHEEDGGSTGSTEKDNGKAETKEGYTSAEKEQQGTQPRRFYATVRLNPLRLSSEAGTIGQEVIQHLEALLDSGVEVTLEITAQSPQGFPDNVVRIVTENARTLKFESFGFEEE